MLIKNIKLTAILRTERERGRPRRFTALAIARDERSDARRCGKPLKN